MTSGKLPNHYNVERILELYEDVTDSKDFTFTIIAERFSKMTPLDAAKVSAAVVLHLVLGSGTLDAENFLERLDLKS